MLAINQLETGFGKKQVLFSVSLNVKQGEIVGLIGPNGAGKSTVLKVICGLIPIWKGEILFDGKPINGASPLINVLRGISYMMQGHRVFDELTVLENLKIGGNSINKKEFKNRLREIFRMFPILEQRINQEAMRLSGGETQLLSLARVLLQKPRLLLLDEPSIGLSPQLVDLVFNKISEIRDNEDIAILLVEQKINRVIELCDRIYSLKLGKVVFDGFPIQLKTNGEKLKELFF